MINWKSILSVYNDKVTLLEYLKKVQKALNEATLEKVETAQDGTNVTLSFVFSDETTIDTVFTVPDIATIGMRVADSNEVSYSQETGAEIVSNAVIGYKKGTPTIAELSLLLPLVGENGINIDADEAGKKLVLRLDEPLSSFLKKTDMKTIFGNQTLYGNGNIDLYRHHIVFTASGSTASSASKIYADIIASNNLKVCSLTDLKTLLGTKFEHTATGYDANNSYKVIGITESGYLYNFGDQIATTAYPVGQWVDTVTTV